jgi:hypothetical protein
VFVLLIRFFCFRRCRQTDQLDAALKEAGMQRNSFGEKYSTYSLRHFYAVRALRNRVGVFEVARNMGTSVQMVQEITASRPQRACLLQGCGTRSASDKFALVINLKSAREAQPSVTNIIG